MGYKINLSAKDAQLIVDALLFTSCTEMCAEWTHAQDKRMVKLAKKFGIDPSDSINLLISDEDNNQVIVKKIIKNFKIRVDRV